MKFLVCAGLAAAFVWPAAAFDNSTCSTFLVGKWSLGVPGGGALSMTLVDGGAMTMDTTMGGKTETAQGTWSAKAGDAADHCKLTAVEKGQAEKPSDTTDVTVKADDTINIGEMGDFKRQ